MGRRWRKAQEPLKWSIETGEKLCHWTTANYFPHSHRTHPHHHKHRRLLPLRQVQPSVEPRLERHVLEWDSTKHRGRHVQPVIQPLMSVSLKFHHVYKYQRRRRRAAFPGSVRARAVTPLPAEPIRGLGSHGRASEAKALRQKRPCSPIVLQYPNTVTANHICTIIVPGNAD